VTNRAVDRQNPRRSKLIVIADNRPELERAARSGADIIQITIEDGVPQTRKQAAREILVRALLEIDWGGAERWVKINPLVSGETHKDIDIITQGRPDAYIAAKAQGPEDLTQIADLIAVAERKHGLQQDSVKICASIERIKALSRVEEMATAHSRMTSLQFGPVDLGQEYGYRLDRAGPSLETLYAKSRCILAARLAGIDIGDSPYNFHQDFDGFLRNTLWSFQLGFTHKACHLVEHIPIIHRAFAMREFEQDAEEFTRNYLETVHPTNL
jgi:citrate lyase subunit beta / citryl-CoA lyase